MISTLQSLASARAKRNFCWLPPERLTIRCAGEENFMFMRFL